MAPNHKLTHLIAGRAVVEIVHGDDKTIVTFDDGSTMRVKNPTAVADVLSAPPQPSWLDKIAHTFTHGEATAHDETAPATTVPATTPVESKGVVKAATQNDTTLVLEFEAGAPLEIALAEADSSVMLRDKAETMEYAD